MNKYELDNIVVYNLENSEILHNLNIILNHLLDNKMIIRYSGQRGGCSANQVCYCWWIQKPKKNED